MKIKKISVTGMFAALIFVFTMFIKVPVVSGYVHFGDALVYVGALILGAPYAFIAAAIGEGLADIIGGYAIYAPATVLIKCILVIPFVVESKNSSKLFTKRTAISTLPAGFVTVAGYFFADLIIDKSYAVADIPGNVVQAAGSAVIFIIIALALDRINIKDKIDLG